MDKKSKEYKVFLTQVQQSANELIEMAQVDIDWIRGDFYAFTPELDDRILFIILHAFEAVQEGLIQHSELDAIAKILCVGATREMMAAKSGGVPLNYIPSVQ